MEYIIEQYCTEIYKELAIQIESKDVLLIKSPTESGKTTFVRQYILNNPELRVLLLLPTRALVDNVGRDEDSIRCGYGSEFIHYLNPKDSCITTYDSLSNDYFEKYKPDVVFVDEAHLMAGHSGFRKVCEIILRYKGKRVFLSGTPEVVERLRMFEGNIINITSKNRRYRHYNIIKTENGVVNQAKEIIKKSDRKNLTIIRINNKNVLQELYDSYCNDFRTALYYSAELDELETVQTKDLTDSVKLGNIPKDIELLLVTSIVDAGLTLKVERSVNVHALASWDMPNAIDMCQLAYRVRSGHGEINLNIYGCFGGAVIDEYAIDYREENLPMLMDRLTIEYENYSRLCFDNYIGLLEYHGLKLNRESNGKKIKTKKQSRVSDIKIIQNLKGVDRNAYNRIETSLYRKSWDDNLEDFFTPDDTTINTSSKVGKARVNGIVFQLLKAVEHNVRLDLILNKRGFESKKLENLCKVISYYKKNDEFKSLVDEVTTSYLDKSDVVTVEDFNSRFIRLNKSEKGSFKELVNLLSDVRVRYDRSRLNVRFTKNDNNSCKIYLKAFIDAA